MLKILFQGDSLTDCGRDKTGHNPVQAYGYGYVNLIASKLLCDYPDTVVWNKAYNGSRIACLLYTSPSPRDGLLYRMPSSA